MPDTVSPPELFWFITAFIGWLITIILLVDAVGDVRAAKVGNGIRQTIAWGRLVSEAGRIVAQTLLLAMSIRAADSGLGARLLPENLIILEIFRTEYVLPIVSLALLVGSSISLVTKIQVRHELDKNV